MNFEKTESQKEELKHYTYRNYLGEKEVVFECDAKDILEADKLYEEATGKDPRKQSDVGCSSEKIEESK